MKKIKLLTIISLFILLFLAPIHQIRAEAKIKLSDKEYRIKGLEKKYKWDLSITGLKGEKVTWKSSNNDIVKVKPVKNNKNKSTVRLIPKYYGSATVTANVGRKKYKCFVIVEKPYIYYGNDGEYNNAISLKLNKGEIHTITNDKKYTKITYTNSNDKVATVNVSDGKLIITAKSPGTTYITEKALYRKQRYVSGLIEVTVRNSSINIVLDQTEIPVYWDSYGHCDKFKIYDITASFLKGDTSSYAYLKYNKDGYDYYSIYVEFTIKKKYAPVNPDIAYVDRSFIDIDFYHEDEKINTAPCYIEEFIYSGGYSIRDPITEGKTYGKAVEIKVKEDSYPETINVHFKVNE